MNLNKNDREYIKFNPQKGWPSGEDLFYECLTCSTVLSSVKDSDCRCHNLYVDASAGRIGANDLDKIRLFKVTDHNE